MHWGLMPFDITNYLLIDIDNDFSRALAGHSFNSFENNAPSTLVIAGNNMRQLVKMMFDELIKDYCYCDFENEISVSEISEPLDTTQPQELEITQIPLNPKLVICGEIYVRVSSNKNFLKGMKVKARAPATEGRVWVMLGRTPRWRGRW